MGFCEAEDKSIHGVIVDTEIAGSRHQQSIPQTLVRLVLIGC